MFNCSYYTLVNLTNRRYIYCTVIRYIEICFIEKCMVHAVKLTLWLCIALFKLKPVSA